MNSEIIIVDGIECKECGKCHEIKSLENYYKQKSNPTGYGFWCKGCVKDYNLEHREHINEVARKNRKENPEKFINRKREYRRKNRERINQVENSRLSKNRDKNLIRRREYRKKNKERILEVDRAYEKRRYYSDPNYRMRKLIRGRLKDALKLYSKNGKSRTSKQYGIDFDAIFTRIGPCPGSGKDWHLDHIIPLVKFDLDNSEHVKLSHVPENLQWLNSFDNNNKHDKFTKQIFLSPVLINILKIIGRYEEACLECFGTTNHEQFEKEI